MSQLDDLLSAQHDYLDAKVAAISSRQRTLVRQALVFAYRDLTAARTNTWTEANTRATTLMLGQAMRQLNARQIDHLFGELPRIVKTSQRQAATMLRTLDLKFTGSVVPLRFDTLDWFTRTSREIGQVRLREFSASFARYGAEAVRKIEDSLARTLLVGKPWYEARDEVWSIVRAQVGGRQWMVDRIIRTEASAAYNGAALQAIIDEDTPASPMLKMLSATFDKVTGRDSYYLHGQKRKPREYFFDAVRGREFMAPPNRPHDREIVVGWREKWGPMKAQALKPKPKRRKPRSTPPAPPPKPNPLPKRPPTPGLGERVEIGQRLQGVQEALRQTRAQAAVMTNDVAAAGLQGLGDALAAELRDLKVQARAAVRKTRAAKPVRPVAPTKPVAPPKPARVKAPKPTKQAPPPAPISMDAVAAEIPDREILRSLREMPAVRPAPSRSLDTHLSGYAGATPEEVNAIATGKRKTMNGRSSFEPARIIVQPGAHLDGFPGIIISDGNHRIEAARRAGAEFVLANVEIHRGEKIKTYKSVLIRVADVVVRLGP